MRYIRYIKANLISSLKSFPALLLMVIMPFLLALFLAFSTKSAFNPSDLNIETKIYIDNQDQGAFGEQIVALFAQLTEEKQIALTSVKDDAKIIATIPADFTRIDSNSFASNSDYHREIRANIKYVTCGV